MMGYIYRATLKGDDIAIKIYKGDVFNILKRINHTNIMNYGSDEEEGFQVTGVPREWYDMITLIKDVFACGVVMLELISGIRKGKVEKEWRDALE